MSQRKRYDVDAQREIRSGDFEELLATDSNEIWHFPESLTLEERLLVILRHQIAVNTKEIYRILNRNSRRKFPEYGVNELYQTLYRMRRRGLISYTGGSHNHVYRITG